METPTPSIKLALGQRKFRMMKAVRERNMGRLVQLVVQCAGRDRNVERVLVELLKQDRFRFCREFF
jgi:hypothetical protein